VQLARLTPSADLHLVISHHAILQNAQYTLARTAAGRLLDHQCNKLHAVVITHLVVQVVQQTNHEKVGVEAHLTNLSDGTSNKGSRIEV
jgi:hypothetical protein